MQLMTSKQKAAELGISRSTLTRWVAAGTVVPAFKAAEKNGITLFLPEPPESSPHDSRGFSAP